MDGRPVDGTELWIQRPGSPLAERLFVGRLAGYEGPVVATLTPAGARILAVLVDEEAEFALAALLEMLPEAALSTRPGGDG